MALMKEDNLKNRDEYLPNNFYIHASAVRRTVINLELNQNNNNVIGFDGEGSRHQYL
jgi:hypothetical protein